MKKVRLLSLFTLILTLAVLLLAGCKKEDKIASVSIKDHDPESVVEVVAGAFDFSGYTLVVTRESGATEEVAVTDDMLSAGDAVKIYQVGEHEITISYEGYECIIKILVSRSSFGDIGFPENNVFTYDGKAHVVEVEGDIPANAVITYPGGNSFVNAGTYDVNAIVSCDGYITMKLSTTVKIEKARYDMSGVKFESREIVYDGKAHSLAISGKLPDGVSSPTYTFGANLTAGAIDVGTYNVTASFKGIDPNYEAIPDMQATLTITPATYEIEGVSFVFKKESGGKIENYRKVYDGEQVVFDISDYNKLSSRISVSFSVYNEAGEKISSSNRETKIIDAGVYTVKAEFTHANGANYYPIDPVSCEFVVEKAAHPSITGVKLDSAISVYNGKEQFIRIEGNVPEGIEVSYVYYLGGKPVLDENGEPRQSVVNAGRYTVEAVFSHGNKNLGYIPSLTAALHIDKVTVDSFILGFSMPSSAVYTGDPFEASFISWKDANLVDFDVLDYGEAQYYVYDSASDTYVAMAKDAPMTNVGSYRIIITMTVKDEYTANYVFSDGSTSKTQVTSFEIRKKTIDIPEVSFSTSSKLTYSGNPQEIAHTISADSNLLDVTTAYYVKRGDNELLLDDAPVNVGSYKLVVTVALKDSVAAHTMFTDGSAEQEYSFEFEIEKASIEIPDVHLTGLTESTYSGDPHVISYTIGGSVDSELVDVTARYYRHNGANYVPLGDGEKPVNAGAYKFVVTVKLKYVENSVFTDGSTAQEYTFEFDINKLTIDISQYLAFNAIYQANGRGVINDIINGDTLADIRNLIHIEAMSIYTYNYGSDGIEMYGDIYDPGLYGVQYFIKVNDAANVALLQNGFETSLTYYWQRFSVE